MIVYRIARTRFIRDLSGTGARLYGGRWNRKGIAVLYTSESRALATLEYLVHAPFLAAPSDLSLAALAIPESVSISEINVADLPDNWRDYPAPPALAELGTRWVLASDTLLLRVPSVVVPDEFNILINPSHPDIEGVTIHHIEGFSLDSRLL